MTKKNFRVRQGLTIGGTTSGSTSLGVGATGTDIDLTLPTAYATTTGDLLSSTTAGVLSWVPAPAGTTYTIDASTVSGGADFNLVGSDATTDTIKFASGTGLNVIRTNANTITFTNTLPAETYNIDASTTTGGANLNLTSPSATDSVAFKGLTGVTVSRLSADTINIAGTTYTQDASTTTGGANLNLVGSDATTDSVAFKGSGSTTVTRTDANTITITSTGGGAGLPMPPSSNMASNPWSFCPGVLNISGIGSSITIGAQSVFYTPFYVADPITLSEVMLTVSTATTLASCNAMIYISEVNISGATGWQPTALLSGGYLGEITNITTTGQKTITGLSTVLPAGAYLMTVQLSNFTGTLQLRGPSSQVILGSGYAFASDFVPYNWRRTGVAYVSGTPAAVANWGQWTAGAGSGLSNWVACKWTVN